MMRDLFQRWMQHPKFQPELLEQVAVLSAQLPQKQKHFQLQGKSLDERRHRQLLVDAAVNVSMEQENFRNMHPDELFAYASRLEEKYAGDISQLKFFVDHLRIDDGFYMAAERALHLFRHFDEQEEVMRFFEDQNPPYQLDGVLKTWFRELGEEGQHYSASEHILASWLIHFAVLSGLPSLKRYTVLARFIQQLYLKTVALDGLGILGMNLSILPHQAMYKRASDQLRFKGTEDMPGSDMNNLVLLGLNIHLSAVREANVQLRDIYQDRIEFEDLTPRQRNMVNFFFDEGFQYARPEKESLNERQQKIIDLVYENHFVSTKDLSLIFRCNRKTIQRDFTELLDMGLVRAMGNGAALRYTVSVRNRPHSALEKLQNIRLSELPAQISLFGDDTEHKKIPTNPGLF